MVRFKIIYFINKWCFNEFGWEVFIIFNYKNCMFLCHGVPNLHTHSVIEVQFLSSQNVSFSISLTSMRPFHSIEQIIIFFHIFILQKNCKHELIFKRLPKAFLNVSFRERNSFKVYKFEAKSLNKKFTSNLFLTTKLNQNQDSATRKSAVCS